MSIKYISQYYGDVLKGCYKSRTQLQWMVVLLAGADGGCGGSSCGEGLVLVLVLLVLVMMAV